MKLSLLIEDSGLEVRLLPETTFDRQALRVLASTAKLATGIGGMLTIPVARDMSNESGADRAASAVGAGREEAPKP